MFSVFSVVYFFQAVLKFYLLNFVFSVVNFFPFVNFYVFSLCLSVVKK